MKWSLILTSWLLVAVAGGCTGCKPASGSANGNGKVNPALPAKVSPPPDVDPIYGHLTHAQPKLPTIKVWVGAEELETEIASRQLEIATGMMYRTNMPEQTAMIFIFGDAQGRNFYMRNCVVPLSAGYIAPDGTLVDIAKLDPGDEKGVQSKSDNVQFVLEVPQGWFERHNISTGAVVRTEKGTLQETFIRRR